MWGQNAAAPFMSRPTRAHAAATSRPSSLCVPDGGVAFSISAHRGNCACCRIAPEGGSANNMRLIGFALLLLLLGSACPGLALSSIRAKCSACRAVAVSGERAASPPAAVAVQRRRRLYLPRPCARGCHRQRPSELNHTRVNCLVRCVTQIYRMCWLAGWRLRCRATTWTCATAWAPTASAGARLSPTSESGLHQHCCVPSARGLGLCCVWTRARLQAVALRCRKATMVFFLLTLVMQDERAASD